MQIALLIILFVSSALNLLTKVRAAGTPLVIANERQLEIITHTHKLPDQNLPNGQPISILQLYPSSKLANANKRINIGHELLGLSERQNESFKLKITTGQRTRRAPLVTNDDGISSLSSLSPLSTLSSSSSSSSSSPIVSDNLNKGSRNKRLTLVETNNCSQTARAAIMGLRCDVTGNDVHDGILVVMANVPTELILIGHNFDANISVAITPEAGLAQADCTHADRVRSQSFQNISKNIARIVIDVPAPMDKPRPYYLCLRDLNGHWWHQGTDPWLQLYVKEDFLPIYMKIIVVAILLMLSGLFSGLNLGLMALDKNELQVIISCGSDTEKRYARAIEPVRRRGNYLLCSILFSNVLVNSTIAVLLEELTSGIVAVMTSTIFIVMFGEILPQAFCSRHGLAVGAKTVSITYFCMIVTFPLSYPVSSCLDWALGEEIGHAYDRERLMEFIRVTRDYNNLGTDEVNIIQGALKLKRTLLSEVMTRIEDVFMLDLSVSLDFDTVQAIIERGYSRVPVHEPGNKKNIVALLFTKDLALLDPDDRTPVQTLISFYNHPIMYLFEDETLDLALDEFKTGKSHMGFVRRVLDDGDRDPIYEITGLVTLEDVIEEIMQMEINDETDILSDNERKRRRKEAQKRRNFLQFSNFGAGQASYALVSPQLCLAAYQYLATTIECFSVKSINDLILKRLMSQKIYYRARVDEEERSERQLYKANEPADYFIMILEGRVRVVCGKESLTFEGGPFSYFGRAALRAPPPASGDQPDAPAGLGKTGPLAISYRRHSEQVDVVGDAAAATAAPAVATGKPIRAGTTINSNTTTTTTTTTTTAAGGTEQRPLNTNNSRISFESTPLGAGNSFFVPDYTVEIAADTSYLKITRQEYLSALRASLIERTSGSLDRLDSPRPVRATRNQRSSSSTMRPPVARLVQRANEIGEGRD